jgi:hypothetical protein
MRSSFFLCRRHVDNEREFRTQGGSQDWTERLLSLNESAISNDPAGEDAIA